MSARRNYILVVSVIVVLLGAGAIVMTVSHSRYNSSVGSDLDALARQASLQNTGKPLVSLDQLPMPDDLRLRQIKRGYNLEVSAENVSVCGQRYGAIWQFSPRETICHSVSVNR